MKKLLLLLLFPIGAIAAQLGDVVLNTDGTLNQPTNFWTSNAAGICSGINATVAPAWSNVSGKPANLTAIAGLTMETFGLDWLEVPGKTAALEALGIPFDLIPSEEWADGDMPWWDSSGYFNKTNTSSFGRAFIGSDPSGGRDALGIADGSQGWTSAATSLQAFDGAEMDRNIHWDDEISAWVTGGNGGVSRLGGSDFLFTYGDYAGSSLSSLFAGSGGYVAKAVNADNIWDGGGYTSTGGFFDGTAGFVAAAQFAYTGYNAALDDFVAFQPGAFGAEFVPNGDYSGDGLAAARAGQNTGGYPIAGLDGSGMVLNSEGGPASTSVLFRGDDSSTHYVNEIYDGTAGWVLTAKELGDGMVTYGIATIGSLFDGSGGYVAYADHAATSDNSDYSNHAATSGIADECTGPANYAISVRGYNAFSASATCTIDDSVIGLTGTSSGQTLTMHYPSSGGVHFIKNQSTQSWTIASASGSQIYTSSAQASITLAAGVGITLASDGTYWNVIP